MYIGYPKLDHTHVHPGCGRTLRWNGRFFSLFIIISRNLLTTESFYSWSNLFSQRYLPAIMAARPGFLNQSLWNTLSSSSSSSSSTVSTTSSRFGTTTRSRLALLFIILLSSAAFLNFVRFVIVRVRDLSDDTVEPHRLFEQVATSLITAGRQVVHLHTIHQQIQNSSSNDNSADSIAFQQALRIGQYPDGTRELHTIADMRSHEILSRIKRIFPSLAFVDEEEETNQLERIQPNRRRRLRPDPDTAPPSSLRRNVLSLSELAIYIDPLDATQEYSEDLTQYVSLSACIVHCGKPVAGLIYMPFSERLYWTRPGTGVHVNFDVDTAIMAEKSIISDWSDPDSQQAVCCDQRLSYHASLSSMNTPQDNSLSDTASSYASVGSEVWKKGIRVIGSRSHKGNVSLAKDIMEALTEDIIASSSSSSSSSSINKPQYIQAGGAGYKLIELVEGRSDAYLHPNRIRKWDLCAGDALLRASGGGITDWKGKPIDYCIYGNSNNEPSQSKRNKESASDNQNDRKDTTEDNGSSGKGSTGTIDPQQFIVQGVIASGNHQIQQDIVTAVKKYGKGQNV